MADDGKTGNLIEALTLPIISSDQIPVIRGTHTYRAYADEVLAPILCAVASTNDRYRCAVSNDPTGRWERHIMPPDTSDLSQQWGSIIWSPDLKMFIAAGLFGNNAQADIVTSKDGKYWWGGLVPTGFNFQQLAYAPSINTLCAVSSAGPTTTARVVTSTDGGKTWTTRSLPTTGITLLGVAWSPTLNLFAAIGTSNAVFTSPDGITWTSRTGPGTSRDWKSIVWAGGAINKFCMQTYQGAPPGYSSDGITWTNGTMSPGSLSTGDFLAYSPTLDMLVNTDGGGAALAYSSNGTSWTRINTGLGSVAFHGITWSVALGLWVATTSSGSTYTSPDSINWTARQPPSLATWNRIAASR